MCVCVCVCVCVRAHMCIWMCVCMQQERFCTLNRECLVDVHYYAIVTNTTVVLDGDWRWCCLPVQWCLGHLSQPSSGGYFFVLLSICIKYDAIQNPVTT